MADGEFAVLHQTVGFQCFPCTKKLGRPVRMEAREMNLEEGNDGFIKCPECGHEVMITVDTYFMA